MKIKGDRIAGEMNFNNYIWLKYFDIAICDLKLNERFFYGKRDYCYNARTNRDRAVD